MVSERLEIEQLQTNSTVMNSVQMIHLNLTAIAQAVYGDVLPT